MKSIQSFRQEFPELPENALQVGYHVLEVLAYGDHNNEAFRRIVVDSIDASGNLMSLKIPTTVIMEKEL